MTMDLSETIAPKSDQLNAEDLLTGPRIVTVTEVRRGSAEQPVEIVTADKLTDSDPAEVARLRSLVDESGADQ
ncbi:hypothetical protein PP512_gp52 [Gordonia phage Denise]|uniref:Uncharacterized protein n=1 Tax=Gordonia phage Denise TaxID=2652879 RepID=A0A5P8DCG0_9CAUD|nr:hypothetical protein PP512_gp52 [Gordonia phage Denise]QFP96667.1 hypothetical protein SEA_DENISE_52 [Gordonia phage Denise]